MNNMLNVNGGVFINVDKIVKITHCLTNEKVYYFSVTLDNANVIKVYKGQPNSKTSGGYARLTEFLKVHQVHLPNENEFSTPAKAK